MIRHSRRGGLAVSAFLLVAGLFAVIVARPAAAAPATLGTDVSNFTTVSSWQAVQAAGMTFTGVMAFDGATLANPKYQSQVSGALGAGLFVMPYVVADPLRIAGDKQFAKAWPVIDGVDGAPYASGGQYLPMALDMEAQPQVTSKVCYGLTQAHMVSWIKAFIAAAEKQPGMRAPVIYTDPGWWKQCTGGSAAFRSDPLWIADYGVAVPAIPPSWSGYTFWQRSNTATISGIAGARMADVDQLEGTVTGAAGHSGSFQVLTLTSLAGQHVSYTAASGLPKGVSVTANGVLRWTSATPLGAFPITVSASGGAVPAAVSLTLSLHGPLTVSAANRSGAVGARVSAHVSASGPDKSHGFAPTLTAAGLPPGLSMTRAGLITGRLTRAGSYKVAVTATDALGGSGAASFTWKVSPAARPTGTR